MNTACRPKILLPAAVLLWFLAGPAAGQTLRLPAHIFGSLGPADAALLTAPTGQALVSINAERPLVPASILKLLTSLAAFHYLGEDFRFATGFNCQILVF